MLVVRINEHDYARIYEKAQEFANGNISVWMRYASIMLEPPRLYKNKDEV